MLLLDISAPGLLFSIEIVQKHIGVLASFSSLRHDCCSELGSQLVLEIAAKTNDHTICELGFALTFIQIAESVVDNTNLSRLNNEMFLSLKHPIEGRHKDVCHPALKLVLHIFWLFLQPRLRHTADINILL